MRGRARRDSACTSRWPRSSRSRLPRIAAAELIIGRAASEGWAGKPGGAAPQCARVARALHASPGEAGLQVRGLPLHLVRRRQRRAPARPQLPRERLAGHSGARQERDARGSPPREGAGAPALRCAGRAHAPPRSGRACGDRGARRRAPRALRGARVPATRRGCGAPPGLQHHRGVSRALALGRARERRSSARPRRASASRSRRATARARATRPTSSCAASPTSRDRPARRRRPRARRAPA